jgi:vacuolar-type H+-ATPase subunit H
LSNLLNNRKQTILSTLCDAEERYKEAIEKLEQARIHLQQAKVKADEIQENGLSQMEREKQELIHVANEDSKRLEDFQNVTIRFEEQRTIEQVWQQVSCLPLEQLKVDVWNLLHFGDRKLHMTLTEIPKPYGKPNILVEYIALQLKSRVTFRRTMEKTIELAKKNKYKRY